MEVRPSPEGTARPEKDVVGFLDSLFLNWYGDGRASFTTSGQQLTENKGIMTCFRDLYSTIRQA